MENRGGEALKALRGGYGAAKWGRPDDGDEGSQSRVLGGKKICDLAGSERRCHEMNLRDGAPKGSRVLIRSTGHTPDGVQTVWQVLDVCRDTEDDLFHGS